MRRPPPHGCSTSGVHPSPIDTGLAMGMGKDAAYRQSERVPERMSPRPTPGSGVIISGRPSSERQRGSESE